MRKPNADKAHQHSADHHANSNPHFKNIISPASRAKLASHTLRIALVCHAYRTKTMQLISAACPLSISSVAKQYMLSPLLSSSGPDFHWKIVIAWAVFALVATAVPYKFRTTWSQLAGFMIATIGALFIFFSVAADSLQAKRALTVLTEQVSTINETLKNPELADNVRSVLMESKKFNMDEADYHTVRIDLAGVLTNFAAMTLGGFGAGMLAAFVTSGKSRRREAQEEALAFEWLRRNLPPLFSFVMLSALVDIVALTVVANSDFIAIPCEAKYVGALFGFVVSVLLVLCGFALNATRAVSPLKRGALVLISLLVIAIYLRATYLSAHYLGAMLLLNALLLLVHHDCRQRILHALSRMTKFNRHSRS